MAELHPEMPIGLFDSGLGGLTVIRELRTILPRERRIYLGDTARTPYGSKGPETIIRYSRECAAFLMGHEVKLMIIACHTASTHALPILAEEYPVPVLGTVAPAVRRAVEMSGGRTIGIIGTQATIACGAYEHALRQTAPEAAIVTKACPLFVPLVEQGMCSGEIVDKIVELYLAELREMNVGALILGCTHYPFLAPAIGKFLGSEVGLIDCSKALAEEARTVLNRVGLLGNCGSPEAREQYFVTDEVSRFNHLASLFLDGSPVEAVKV